MTARRLTRQGAIVEAPVKLGDLPPHVPQAFIANRGTGGFHSHWGIDPRGIARALFHRLWRGGFGTITQQLAKFTFPYPRTIAQPQGAARR